MTNQEALNRVVDWFIVQGNPPAADGRDGCCYRTPDHRRCAIGCLIPDEVYIDDIEGMSALAVISGNPSLPRWNDKTAPVRQSLAGLDPEFAEEMQSAHDGWSHTCGVAFLPYFAPKLADVARDYELEIPPALALLLETRGAA